RMHHSARLCRQLIRGLGSAAAITLCIDGQGKVRARFNELALLSLVSASATAGYRVFPYIGFAATSNTDTMQRSQMEKKEAMMNEPIKERRRASYSTLIDAAMRSTSQLFVSKDIGTRSAASRVLSDLQKLRAEMPKRRQDDHVKTG
ncbi:MAG: hypothetical protein ACXWJD_12135, partial [Burkholderiaceae bacterium]